MHDAHVLTVCWCNVVSVLVSPTFLTRTSFVECGTSTEFWCVEFVLLPSTNISSDRNSSQFVVATLQQLFSASACAGATRGQDRTGQDRTGQHSKAQDRTQDTGHRRQGAGERRQGTGYRGQGAGKRRKGTGERRRETGDRRQDTGDRTQGAGNKRQEKRDRREEPGDRTDRHPQRKSVHACSIG